MALDFVLGKLQGLLRCNAGPTVPPQDHEVAILYSDLGFLKNFLMDPPLQQYKKVDIFNSLLIQIEAAAREAGAIDCQRKMKRTCKRFY